MTAYTNQELIKIKNSLEQAQRVAKIGSWDWNIVTGALWWSQEIYRIFGLEVNQFEATYEAFLNMIHPEDIEVVTSAVNSAVEGKSEYNIEHRIVLSNGEIRFVHEQGFVSRDEDNKPTHMVGTVLDITDVKKVNEKLKLSSEVIKNSIEGILITDSNKKIIEINPAFSEITGYTFDEVYGKEPSILKSGWQGIDFYINMWSDIEKFGRYKGELWDRKKDGELYAASLSISAINDDRGNITHYVAITSDITKKQENEKKIHNLAYYDMLTSLPNRTLFHDRANQKISSAKHHKEDKVAFLFLDLDNFKYVNDSLGHHVGDIFLQSVAKRVSKLLDDDMIIARLGGDEFMIMIEHNINSRELITKTSKNIIDELSKPFNVDGHEVYTGVSIGISIFPDDGNNYDSLIKQSDIAMYKAKKLGKNRFEFFLPIMNDEANDRLFVENGIRNAITNNELFLEYQPKICLKDNSVSGMEALVRWNHNERGIIPPFKFIPIVESGPLIIEIGNFVLKSACAQTLKWHEMGFCDLVVSVNVSSFQLKQDNYIEVVKNILDELSFNPEYLELEITESTIMVDIERSLEKLNELKDLGITISIDDFGTGYSSISYLKKLPAKVLKIDKSFVMDSHFDSSDKSIMTAIIALAKSLGLETIAEGAELQEHIDILNELGCEKVQGYYFSKPLGVEKFEEYLHRK